MAVITVTRVGASREESFPRPPLECVFILETCLSVGVSVEGGDIDSTGHGTWILIARGVCILLLMMSVRAQCFSLPLRDE